MQLETIPPAKAGAKIDYELFLDCVHCGLCTSACPTYAELGTEADSPRGRIYLMRAVTDGKLALDDNVRGHLDLCLDCRACETACPSGVQYGRLIEPFRIHMEQTKSTRSRLSRIQQTALFHLTPFARRMRWALGPAKLMQWLGLDKRLAATRLFDRLPASLRQMHEMLPPLSEHHDLPERLPAFGKRRAKVALFLGCAGDAFFPQTNLATARVLQHNGCEVWIPKGQGCCGALHFHAAQEREAQLLAATNVKRFERELHDLDAIIVNAAGCGAQLKEYHHLLHGLEEDNRLHAFVHKVKDISEFLIALDPVKPYYPVPLRAAYHDACHLCHAQQIRKQPRQLLELIPGLTLVPLAESELCCGAAGSYNLTQPEMAHRLGERKRLNIQDAQVQAVFAGNVGCLLQIGKHLRKHDPAMIVGHPVDALWAAYGGKNVFSNKR